IYTGLSTLARRGPGRKGKGLILVGLPRDGGSELENILARLGPRPVGSFPHGEGIEEWRRLGEAGAAFIVDRTLYPRFAAALESRGMSVEDVPLPVGLGQSRMFFETIARRFGVQGRVPGAVDRDARACGRAIARFRAEFRGLRLAYALRMCNNYEGDLLAYEGLGDLEFFAELGFQAALLVQGAPEADSKRRIGARLRSLGRREPFLVFPDPIELPGILRKVGFSLAYLGGHAGPEADRAQVPIVAARSLAPFFQGCLANIARIRALLERRR
ncbi:MAG: nitrogenase component 1, partial [Elusimicrobia bacterium]|nr:nitrogenase component 1 [Elusimicrobiota bacterium]